jgi:hypothetical protein
MTMARNSKSLGRVAASLLLALAAETFAQTGDPPPNLWFPVGEVLSYNVYWGVIAVGTSRMSSEWVEEEGRRLLAIRMRTRSNKFLSAIYPVDDFIESVIDPATFLPVRLTEKMNEGRHHKNEITTFDHAAGKATWKSLDRDREKQFDIEADTRDLLSFMYHLRSRSECFEPGREHRFRIFVDEKLYDLILNPLAIESVDLDKFGKVSSVRFEPEAQFNGLFVRKGKLWLWVSADDRRILTRAAARIPVASVKILLTRVSGPGGENWEKAAAARPDAGKIVTEKTTAAAK